MIKMQPAAALNFKNTFDKKEKADVDYKLRTERYKEQDRVAAAAALAGLGTGAVSKIRGKNNSLNKGIYGYFASLFMLMTLNGVKNARESKDFYKDYETNYEYKNKFDKFIGSLAIPEPIDLGDEEKNRNYFEVYKKEHLKGIKMLVLTLAAGAAVGIVCLVKKIPDKWEKITTASVVTAGVSLAADAILSDVVKKSKDKKGVEELDETKNKETP